MIKLSSIFALFVLLSFSNVNAQLGLKVGDVALPFKLKNTDGKMISLADYNSKKGVIVIFTCNHCPFAVAYEDRIIELHKKYASLGYPVISINPNDAIAYPEDDFASMKKRAKEKKFPFVYLHDETQDIAKAYGAQRTPHVYILQNEDLQFKIKYVGAIDDNTEEPEAVTKKYVESALNSLIEGKPVAESSTKAIGCSIKWKK
jgi:peroxiredoxin